MLGNPQPEVGLTDEEIKEHICEYIRYRNSVDYAVNTDIMELLPAFRDAIVVHYGVEQHADCIIWPTVDLFFDEQEVPCIVVMGHINQDEEIDIALIPPLSAVVPIALAIENDVQRIIDRLDGAAEFDNIVDQVDQNTKTIH